MRTDSQGTRNAMNSKDIKLLNKRSDILFRHNRGDTNTAIAATYGVSRQVIIRHLKRATLDKQVKKSAKLRQQILDEEEYT
jgi:DNA-binding transcriptional regulator LsrR (DeoR family)